MIGKFDRMPAINLYAGHASEKKVDKPAMVHNLDNVHNSSSFLEAIVGIPKRTD